MSDAIICTFPAIIKAKTENGKRIVSVEASAELVDAEGDVIERAALLGSAESFVKTGHLDLEHISEIGRSYGIPDPSSYIVGVPLEVYPIDGEDGIKRTGVLCEIFRSKDGVVDTKKHKYDEFWESLQTDPPVRWRASIYGFPKDDGIIDCSRQSCKSDATRFHVSKLDWRSLAFTKNPVNDAIKGFAKIESIKSYMAKAAPSPREICPSVARYIAWTLVDQTLNEFKENSNGS